jgi:hypothetical protein
MPDPPASKTGPGTLVARLLHYYTFNQAQASCTVSIYRGRAARFVVILSEAGDPPMINRAVELLATELLPLISPDPEIRNDMIWVAHYQPTDAFNFVTFHAFDAYGPTWARNAAGVGFSGPRWSRSTKSEIADVIGAEFKPLTEAPPAAEVKP